MKTELSNLKEMPLWYDREITGVEHDCHKMFGRYKILQYKFSMNDALGYGIIEIEGIKIVNSVVSIDYCPFCGEKLK